MNILNTLVARNLPRLLRGGRPISITRSIRALAYLRNKLLDPAYQHFECSEDFTAKQRGGKKPVYITAHTKQNNQT